MRQYPVSPLRSAALALLLAACNPLDKGADALNVAKVKFSEGSPAVDGQTIAYSGSPIAPKLEEFKFKLVFHVKADNSGNTGKAAFGTDAVRPVVSVYIESRSGKPIETTIPSFSIEGGAIDTLAFPIEIPITAIDNATARKIVNGDSIPYFLAGKLEFNLLEGTLPKGSGTAQLELASGKIATRPTGVIANLLSGLL